MIKNTQHCFLFCCCFVVVVNLFVLFVVFCLFICLVFKNSTVSNLNYYRFKTQSIKHTRKSNSFT